MKARHLITCGSMISLLALAACGSSGTEPISEDGPGTRSEEFSTTPGEPNHEQITATALSFLRPDVRVALQVANVATDAEFFLVNANHFDDCNFSGGSEVVARSQAEAVARLDPNTASPETDLLAIRAFGRSLHALQDFYAHTNWIELGGTSLVDETLGRFPSLRPYATLRSSGFVIVEGRAPKKTTVSRDASAAYPETAVVRVSAGKDLKLGLVSGTVDYEPGNACPDAAALPHDELNKDKSTNVGRSSQYEAAKTLAILQTEHEWCRLRALTAAKWGKSGVARLDTWVQAGSAAPSCN